MAFLNLGSTAKFFEKSVIRQVNPFEFLLDRLTRQGIPMRMCRPFQIGCVCTHCLITCVGQPVFIALTLPLMEILVDLPHIIKQVAKPNTIGLIIKRIFVGFHGLSGIRRLSAKQSEASTLPSGNAVSACQPDTTIIPQFHYNCQVFSGITPLAGLYPKPKGLGFTPEFP